MCVCVRARVFHSFLYRLLFCNDLKNQKKSCFLSSSFLISHSVCVYACLVLLISFVFFFRSFSFFFSLASSSGDKQQHHFVGVSFLFLFLFIFFFVFGFNRSTLLDSHTRKQKLCSLPVCAFSFFFSFFFVLEKREETFLLHVQCVFV